MKKFAVNLILILAVAAPFLTMPSEADAQNRRDRRRAEQLVVEGDTLYQRREYEQAILRYARALALVPQYPLAHYNKGRAHFNLQQYPEAISEFSLALDQGADALSIYSIRWRARFELRQYDQAMADVQQAKRLAPENDYFYIGEGQILHQNQDFRGAITAYRRAIDLGSKNPNVSYLLALSYNGVGEWALQEEFAKKALGSATTMPDMAWYLLGDAQQRLRKYDEAIKSYQNAMSVNRELYGVYINLAEAFRVQNNLKDAVATAQQGIEKFPNDPTLQINISWYYSLSNRNALAIQYAKKATELAPNQYLGYTNLCRAYNDSSELDLALQNCERALELQPGDGETSFYMGRNYQLREDVDKALEYYRKAVTGLEAFTKANPNYADGFYLLGNAYSATEQNRKAIGAYVSSLEIAPLFARSRFNLGVIYLREGEAGKAREQAQALEGIDAQLAKRLREAIGN